MADADPQPPPRRAPRATEPPFDRQSTALAAASDPWRRLAGWQHALAMGVILVATLARFYPAVTSAEPLGDEISQEAAFRLAEGGHSPYLAGDYVYPPTLLRIGAVLHRLPLRSPFLPLRCATLLGLAVVLWTATAWLAWRPWQRVGIAVLYALLAPGVRQGIEFGNLSFAVSGMIVLALLAWSRAPIAGGLLLGASLLVKPLAPAAITALLFYREKPGRKHWLTAGVAVAVAAWALLADPELGAFLQQGSSVWVISRTVSAYRFLSLAAGSEAYAAAAWLMGLLLVGVAAVARWCVFSRQQLLAVALAGCVVVTPVVWNHTLVLTLPLQAMAFTLAASRYRNATKPDRRWRRWETAGIALALAALTFAEGATGIDDRGVVLQVFATLPPALAPAILAAYVLRFDGATLSPARQPPLPA